MEDEELFNKANLQLVGSPDSVVSLTQEFSARGKTKLEALENAKKLAYSYSVMDSVITFEEGYDLRALETFRDQQVNLTLRIPYDRPFIMERSLLEILRNTISNNGYRSSDVRSSTVWVFNEAGLVCLTCPLKNENSGDWDEEESTKRDSLNKAKMDSITRAKFADSPFMSD